MDVRVLRGCGAAERLAGEGPPADRQDRQAARFLLRVLYLQKVGQRALDSYHFCIDSSYLGLGRTVELIQTMVAHKEHPIPSPTEEDPTRPKK